MGGRSLLGMGGGAIALFVTCQFAVWGCEGRSLLGDVGKCDSALRDLSVRCLGMWECDRFL
ncbi:MULTISPECIES: hypothetical protein [unclassified Microcystis]|jgi:hypothetical protein|uniref:hypothetical protein n=1 Tax=unclassified Microcystis TaxID=2643300 RepID=UPI001DE66C43|nr:MULTISPECIES: hypothetical protein [unclassified Microcystis]MCA2522331.1 hypothetical protein [Microcystis sp. M63BS1]MCA2610218.1 hypothetical protein [Microcystis sp. M27BS1]MCA2613460.1 hypothetical protein [Microcystis sp. M25BS1]NCS30303.1 hypothetical protein [Microcystis aeruginosa F13-15]MCA2544597.1 hypothetical protein [Microcystis sp. M55BS1]